VPTLEHKDNPVSLIEFGGAGRTFARETGWRSQAQVFDLNPPDELRAENGVAGRTSIDAALKDSAASIAENYVGLPV